MTIPEEAKGKLKRVFRSIMALEGVKTAKEAVAHPSVRAIVDEFGLEEEDVMRYFAAVKRGIRLAEENRERARRYRELEATAGGAVGAAGVPAVERETIGFGFHGLSLIHI